VSACRDRVQPTAGPPTQSPALPLAVDENRQHASARLAALDVVESTRIHRIEVLEEKKTNTDLLELELNDSETPVFRIVYLISVANS